MEWTKDRQEVAVKVPLTDIHTNLDEIVKGLSDKIRQIVFGILAFVWLFLAGGPSTPTFHLVTSNRPLLGIGAACLASLLCDLAQSVFAYWSSYKTLREAETAGATETEYDESDWRRYLQFAFFYAKIGFGVVAAVWLVYLFVAAVI